MSGERGFTLVEVLVALAVLGLTTMLLSEGLRLGARARDRGEAAFDRAAARLDAGQILRRLIGSAEPPGPSDGAGAFAGEPERLMFLSTAAARLDRGAARLVEIARAPATGELRLRVLGEGGGEIALVDGARAVAFSYRGAGAAAQWTERWPDPGLLPALVRLAVVFHGEEPPLELTIATRRRLSAECLAIGIDRCRGSAP